MCSRETIYLTLAFDNNYLNQFYALITSAFYNNVNNKIIVYAIISNLDEYDIREIHEYVDQFDSNIYMYKAPANFGANFRLDGNWTAAAYYRLLFPSLLPSEVKKYIYVDTDTLIVGSLASLWHTDVSQHVLAAVRDRLIPVRPDLGITVPGTYFNSGVLVVNKELWIERKITELSIEFLNKYPEKVFYADQDALNYLLHNQWQQLDIRYNLMFADIPENLPSNMFKSFLQDKVVIHFTQHRPWNILCENRFRYLYHYYLEISRKAAGSRYNKLAINQKNIKNFAKIRLRELYFDNPRIAKMWQRFKYMFKLA